MRRALSAGTGRIKFGGDPDAAPVLARALRVGSKDAGRDHLHGFHSYSARLAPRTVETLLAEVPPGKILLDPFAGSGTTLVEANRRGLAAIGVDASPLAVRLATLKLATTTDEDREALITAARGVSERSHRRAKERKRTESSGSRYDDPRAYEPHVFRELVGLREEINVVTDAKLHETLLFVLSAIVVKFSRSAITDDEAPRQIGRGVPSRFFLRKAEELARAQADFAALRRSHTAMVHLGDARRLPFLKTATIDCVVTSPPYLGTYDYVDHHVRRYGWLGIDPKAFAAAEIGARRRDDAEAEARYRADSARWLSELGRVVRPHGWIAIVVGDSTLGTRDYAGDELIGEAIATTGVFEPIAWAYEARPQFYAAAGAAAGVGARRDRREHLLLYRRRKA